MLEQSVVQPRVVEPGLVSTGPQIGSVSRAVNWRQVGLFLAVTFTLTYALNLILHLGWGYGNNAATGTLLQLQMLIPAAVAIVLQLFVFKTSPIYHLRQGPRWFFYVYLGYVAFFVLGAAASIARPDLAAMLTTVNTVVLVLIVLFIVILRLVTGREAFRRTGLAGGKWWYYPLFGLFLTGAYALMTALNALFELGRPADIQQLYALYGAGASGLAGLPLVALWLRIAADFLLLTPILNLVFFFGEECGWRGYLQSELVKMGKVRGLLLVGVIWGVWHTPIIVMGHNYPGYPLAGSALMILCTIVLAFLFGFAVLKSGSVWLAAFLHGLNNSVIPLLFGMVYQPDSPVLAFGWGVLGLLVWGLMIAGLLFFWRRWWKDVAMSTDVLVS
jgi:membrane protease YdiL (CAAX protease family)